jgi:hypothetical protein
MRSFVIGFVMVIGVLAILASFAPHDVHQPARPTAADSRACGYWGPAVSSTITNTAGPYPLASVRCRSGITVDVAEGGGR